MKTIKLPYTIDDPVSREHLDLVLSDLRQTQSSIYHVAYKRASEGLTEKEIRDHCRNQFPDVDSWFIQSAVKKGIGQFKADWELAKKQNREFSGNRIFGDKKNFKRRIKGLISNEEWKECRLEDLYVIGEIPHKGNRKFDFNLTSINFKPWRGTSFDLVLPELHGSYKKEYEALVIAAQKKLLPVTISLNDKFIFISFEEDKLPKPEKQKKYISGRYLGVDLNPNYIGVSYFDENQELLETQLFNFKGLTGKNINSNKLKHELREVAIAIGYRAQHYQIQYFFVEDLSFKQGDTGLGRWFNRLTKNQFLINEFNRMLGKFGKVIKVNAAYSSTIGNVVHFEYPDPIAASMEIARRGIESRVVKGSKKFYPPMVSDQVLQRRWKDVVLPKFGTWIELHNFLKKTGLKYRVDIPSVSMFRFFSSTSSRVLVY